MRPAMPIDGIWSAGQVQGLIHDIPTCAELVSRIMRDAEAIIRERFAGMLSGSAASGRRVSGVSPTNKKRRIHESLCLRRQRR